MKRRRRQKGMVLVFALWTLGILTILAVSVAAGIRQKIFLVGRLDERARMEYLLEAAVKKTAGYIHQQMEVSSFAFSATVKMNLLNNAGELSTINLGHDSAGVGYIPADGDNTTLRWGVVDEESKIDLNKTNQMTLETLLSNVLSMKDEDASKLAVALLDWSQIGEGELTGFYSDDYYSNLQYPYPKKSASYETLDEILLVKTMTKEMYNKFVKYVTIYGDGGVNVNTASKEVLVALGLPDELADKVLTVRRGRDNVDGTADDHAFLQPYDISTEVNAVIPLTIDEARAIDSLSMRGILTTNSYYFTIEATGKLASRGNPRSVRAVYSAREDKIIYWKER